MSKSIILKTIASIPGFKLASSIFATIILLDAEGPKEYAPELITPSIGIIATFPVSPAKRNPKIIAVVTVNNNIIIKNLINYIII